MIYFIEINVDCIDEYNAAVPNDIVFEHLLNFYRHATGAKLHAVEIEVKPDNKLKVVRNGFYIDVAKILGKAEIRAAIINGSERIMQLYNDCILNKDLRETYEKEMEEEYNEIYELLYFKNKIALKEYMLILSMFNDFVSECDISVYSVSFNVEENFIAIHLKTLKFRFLEDSNALFRFLIDVNVNYKIDTVNGVKLERYLPPL